jgi:hypothetical protein
MIVLKDKPNKENSGKVSPRTMEESEQLDSEAPSSDFLFIPIANYLDLLVVIALRY